MGKYITLEGGKDWLEGSATLFANRQASAEAAADERIDREFHPWKAARRSWVTSSSTPKQIRRIALLLASAEYHAAGMTKGNPDAEQPAAAVDLFKRADKAIEEIKAAGYIVGDNDEPILPDPERSQGIFPGVER